MVWHFGGVSNAYWVVHLESWVHKSKNIFIVTWLQTDNIINHVIHLSSDRNRLYYTSLLLNFISVSECNELKKMPMNKQTSFSQLEVRVSKAMGLLGALLPGPGGMPCSGGWLGHWPPALPPRVVDRYCLTCCLWACWMWYFVGLSRWDCTLINEIELKG